LLYCLPESEDWVGLGVTTVDEPAPLAGFADPDCPGGDEGVETVPVPDGGAFTEGVGVVGVDVGDFSPVSFCEARFLACPGGRPPFF
jgi:hypothetical protein